MSSTSANDRDASSPSDRQIAHVLRLLEGGHRTYQRAAVDEALTIGAPLEPALLGMLDKVLAEPEAFTAFGNEDYAGHLYALALLTHFRVAQAHRAVLRLARLPEALVDQLLGQGVSALLPAALYRTSGGSSEEIERLAADPLVAMPCRDAALGALVLGALEDEERRRAVLELFGAFLTEPDRTIADMDFVSHVANRALDLYPAPIMPAIEQAFRKGRIDPFTIALADFERVLEEDEQAVLAASRQASQELLPADPHRYLTRWADLEQPKADAADPARDDKARQRALQKKRKQDRKRARKARKRR